MNLLRCYKQQFTPGDDMYWADVSAVSSVESVNVTVRLFDTKISASRNWDWGLPVWGVPEFGICITFASAVEDTKCCIVSSLLGSCVVGVARRVELSLSVREDWEISFCWEVPMIESQEAKLDKQVKRRETWFLIGKCQDVHKIEGFECVFKN